MSVLERLKRFGRKSYRDEYLRSSVRGSIAYQMRALRKSVGLSQEQFGKKIGKPQSVVSRLENTEYGTVSIQSLLDVATSLDVALIVRFVSYPTFLEWASRMSESELQPETIHESIGSETTVRTAVYKGPVPASKTLILEQRAGEQAFYAN